MRIWAPVLAGLSLIACQTTQIVDQVLPKNRFITELMTLRVTIDGSAYALSGLMVRPRGAAPHPLAVLTHGSCGSACRARRSPAQLHSQANVFAKWGYAAFVLMRRDNGTSDGPYAEGYGGCDVQNYEAAATATAADLAAAIRSLQRLPYIDGSKTIAIGQSGGGIGVIALSARKIQGVRAVINVSGGRGGTCIRRSEFDENKMTGAFSAFGRRARVPTLWMYTENDNYWGAVRPRLWYDAFIGAGGAVNFVLLRPIGSKGHSFFYKASSIPIWRPVVAKFLQHVGMPAGGTRAAPQQTRMHRTHRGEHRTR